MSNENFTSMRYRMKGKGFSLVQRSQQLEKYLLIKMKCKFEFLKEVMGINIFDTQTDIISFCFKVNQDLFKGFQTNDLNKQ